MQHFSHIDHVDVEGREREGVVRKKKVNIMVLHELLHNGCILVHFVSSEAQLKEMMENEAGSVATTPNAWAGVVFCWPAAGRSACFHVWEVCPQISGCHWLVFACSWSAEDDAVTDSDHP